MNLYYSAQLTESATLASITLPLCAETTNGKT